MKGDSGRGPYHYGRRLRGLDASIGRLYETRGPTGQPALLQTPTGEVDWRQGDGDVQVLVTAFSSPRGLSIEVQGEPPSTEAVTESVRSALAAASNLMEAVASRHEVSVHLSRVAVPPQLDSGTDGGGSPHTFQGASAEGESRPDVASIGHQAAPVASPRSASSRVRWGVALAASVAALALLPSQVGTGERQEDSASDVSEWIAEMEAAPDTTPDAVAYTDLLQSSSSPTMTVRKRIVMPTGPFPNQDRPPCREGYSAIRGGCWAKLDARPPKCPDGAVEHEGGCYLPVTGGRPTPAPKPNAIWREQRR